MQPYLLGVVWLKGGSNAQTDLGLTRPAATTASIPLLPLLLLTSAACVSRQLLVLTLLLPARFRASYKAFWRDSGTFRLNPRIVLKSYDTGSVNGAAARKLLLCGLLRRLRRVAVSTGAAPPPAQYHSSCRNLRLLLVLLLLSPRRAVPGSSGAAAAAADCASHATHSSAVSSRRHFISSACSKAVLSKTNTRHKETRCTGR
jgi:hypothetical protein